MNANFFRLCMAACVAATVALAPGFGWTDGDATADNPDVPVVFPSDLASASVDGVECRIIMEGEYGFGDQPVALIEARNPGDNAISTVARLVVSSLPESAIGSRVPQAPQVRANVEVKIELEASETRVIRVELSKDLLAAPAGAAEGLPVNMSEFRLSLLPNSLDGAAIALGGGQVLARFSISLDRVVQIQWEVVRDEDGKPVKLNAHLRNISKITVPDLEISLMTEDGDERPVRPAASNEAVTIKAGENATLSWTLGNLRGSKLAGALMFFGSYKALDLDLEKIEATANGS